MDRNDLTFNPEVGDTIENVGTRFLPSGID